MRPSSCWRFVHAKPNDGMAQWIARRSDDLRHVLHALDAELPIPSSLQELTHSITRFTVHRYAERMNKYCLSGAGPHAG